MTGNKVIKFKDHDTLTESLQDAEKCEKAIDLPKPYRELEELLL